MHSTVPAFIVYRCCPKRPCIKCPYLLYTSDQCGATCNLFLSSSTWHKWYQELRTCKLVINMLYMIIWCMSSLMMVHKERNF